MIEKLLDVKGILLVSICRELIIRVFRNIIFPAEEWPYAPELENTFAAVHDGQFILAHEFLAELLIIEAVGYFLSPAFPCVERIDRFLSELGAQFLECRRFNASQKNVAVTVADNGIAVVLVNGLELGLGLQYEACGYLSAADRGDQLLKVRDLSDIGHLIDEASYVHRQPSPVNIVRFFAQQVKKLCVYEGDQEVESRIRVGHDEKKSCLPVSYCIERQLVVGSDLTKFFNVKWRKPRTAAHEYTFQCFA